MRILASIALGIGLAASAAGSKASDLYRQAQKYEKAGNVIQAYTLYAQASAMEPKNENYRLKTIVLQGRANRLQQENLARAAAAKPAADGADTEDPDAVAIDDAPDQAEVGTVTNRELEKARQALPPAQVKLTSGRFDFHLNVTPQDLFDQVAKRCGLQTVFDSEYGQSTTKVRFDIEDVDCRAALHAVESATSSFIVPLSSKLILISKDTTVKRAANEQTMSVVVPVNTVLTTQDITEIAQAVKQVAGVDKLAWSAASNEILIRDRVSRVRVAQEVIRQLTSFRGSVVFDLRFLQLTDSDVLSYGVTPTNTLQLIWGSLPQIAAAGAPLNAVLRALQRGTHVFGITGIDATLVAQLTKSSSRTILQTQIRAVNGLPATLHVGQKYPVLTAGYFGGTPTTPGNGGGNGGGGTGTVYTPPPSFQYYDLGVSLKVLPSIGNDDLMMLHVESEYQLLAGQSIDGIPVLASRKYATDITLHNNEWAVIGGLMDETQSKNVSGVAGLSRIPFLNWLFKTTTREKDRDHIVIVMKPHLVGEAPSSHETAPMAVGTETRPLSPI